MGGPLDSSDGGGREPAVCRRCGRANSPAARYCGSCGAALRAAANEQVALALAEGDRLAEQSPRLFPEARRAYLAAARLAPDDPVPLMLLARLCRKTGRKPQAKIFLRQAAQRDPSYWWAWAEGADCCGQFQVLRRCWWLGKALGAGRRSGEAVEPAVQHRFWEHYGRLRPWEKWLIRKLTGNHSR